MGAERRIHQRASLNMLVQFRLADIEQFMREYAANVSAGGMFIRTREPKPQGSMIYLQVKLSDGSKMLEGLGKVIHVNPPDSAVPGMGIEFVNLDADSRKVIDQIINERVDELDAIEPEGSDESATP